MKSPGLSQWRSSLSNGTETVGTLRLKPQPGHQRDEHYLRACEIAELTAHLVERVLTEQASNELLRVRTKAVPAQSSKSGVSVTIERPAVQQHHPLTYAEALLRTAVRQSGFPAAALLIQEPGTEELRLHAQHDPGWLCVPRQARQMSGSTLEEICRQEETRFLRRSEISDDEVCLLPDHVAVGVCRGITAAGRVLGTLWLYDRRDRRLTLREQHSIDSIAERLGELIERTRLMDESERSQRLRVELQVAARSQPAARIHHQGTDGWCELAGHSESSVEVGGDLLEVIPLPDDRLFVAIGDAAGHSIPAAMLMASVRGALRAILDLKEPSNDGAAVPAPHEVLRRVNSVLHGIVDANQFMTMFCALVDRRRMLLEYASAGHPPALLMRCGEVQPLEQRGLVLGVLDDVIYRSTVFPVRPGDLLAFYTDGISEAVDASHQMFGSQGITTISIRHQHDPLPIILDNVWRELEKHLSDSSCSDDRTLALLRINPSVASSSESPVNGH